jgi:hypothetical protein
LNAQPGADHNEPRRPRVVASGAPGPVRQPVPVMQEIAHQHLFNQFWLSVFFVIPMVLVARRWWPGRATRRS